jgi:hypothetical protein
MLIVGNIDIDNTSLESGIENDIRVKFILPRKLRRSSQLFLKYFAFYQGYFEERLLHGIDANVLSTGKQYLWRYIPHEIQMKVFGNGEDLLADNTLVSHVREVSAGVSDTRTINYLPFQRTMLAEAGVNDVAGPQPNNIPYGHPYSVSSGHQSVYDMKIGTVHDNVSEIEVVLKVLRDIKRVFIAEESDQFSFEEKVRIDSISFVLELIE